MVLLALFLDFFVLGRFRQCSGERGDIPDGGREFS
jgi:hypothetical protein